MYGTCMKLNSCPWALEEVRKGRRPKICLYSGPFPIVCCPSTERPPNGTGSEKQPTAELLGGAQASSASPVAGRIARMKCKEYSQYVYEEVESLVLMPTTERQDMCAASADPLIVGGTQAKAMEFPHMTLVGFGKEDDVKWLCGGSLISPDFVLTAAHCLVSEQLPAAWVLLGELDLTSSEDDSRPQKLAVAERFKHPDYKPPVSYHDIGLLRLKSPAELSGYVRPACLHTKPSLRGAPLEEVPVATGWGNIEWVGEKSPYLMKVALRVTNHSACDKAYSSASKMKLPQGILADSMVCAGGSGKDTCQGDSGGPLQVSTRNYSRSEAEPYCMYKVVGVTSFGQACGFNAPGIYTRVYHYVPWIEKIVWPIGSA